MTENLLLFSRPANHFGSATVDHVQRLKQIGEWVELEARWTNISFQRQTQLDQHTRLVELVQSKGHQMMVLNLPYRDLPLCRNTTFHFRDELLTALRECLQPCQQLLEIRSVGLHGLGGVGKTQIALEFAYRYMRKYDAIFWVEAETSAKLKESFSAYGKTLVSNGTQPQQHDAQQIETFRRWLMSGQIQGLYQFCADICTSFINFHNR